MGKRPVWSEYNFWMSDVGRRRAERLFVVWFCGSWEGLTSRDVERGSKAGDLVDCKFFCSIQSVIGLWKMFFNQGFAESGPRGKVAASYGAKEG